MSALVLNLDSMQIKGKIRRFRDYQNSFPRFVYILDEKQFLMIFIQSKFHGFEREPNIKKLKSNYNLRGYLRKTWLILKLRRSKTPWLLPNPVQCKPTNHNQLEKKVKVGQFEGIFFELLSELNHDFV